MYVAQRPYHNEEGSWVKVCQNAMLVLTSPGPMGERESGELLSLYNETSKGKQMGVVPNFDWLNICICILLGLGERWCHDSVWTQCLLPCVCICACMPACAWGVCLLVCVCVCERLGRRRGLSKAGMQGYITMRSWELRAVCIEGRRNVNER